MMDILNVGAGNKIVPGAVNHDRIQHRPEIDVAWDLNELPWPWEDNRFDFIAACAVLEHLRITLVDSMNECWRILRPGGHLHVKVPYWHHENSYQDPTHYWRYTLGTFDLFDPSTKYGHDYAFYTGRKWMLVRRPRLNQQHSSIIALLQVVK